ncbi:4-diphosphocytidyl-2-C-methyl-D-erythritol kinase [Lacunisphaera limnophila]|uniref:4-diphosphocytidyl-2-C-methyl-D-erythritol kinase n=1 Tax=Lacunisphaera limnophila TaxID=1838286 RepID=A0A1D8AVK5_9BACT|nr:4-(cytidine 5'-diphospho)-2-C-methyl-D-erythritol kinase [Lacunisphaera limnophila]AOS44896.1 4-diphosphocytidyl-2-C-methyl-D-erythritol kinase [Lacunisphaera limnophila]
MGVTVFSPAKLNLFLAVTGRRPDGFHDLVSVAAPLDFGDELEAETGGRGYALACDDPAVPVDGSNLVLRAAGAYAVATGWDEPVRFRLTKRIPVGAGLGGGSSNAVAALRALNQLAGGRLGEAQLAGLAAALGSDCALFLAQAPVVMRGRGERVEPLAPGAAARLRGRRVLVFKPAFGISTPWAYGRMVARGTDYLPADQAEARLARWLGGEAAAEELLYNNMEPAAFEKYVPLPLLLAKLRAEFGVAVAMSGSGSACYALLHEPDTRGDAEVTAMSRRLREWAGAEIFMQEARLA